MSNSSVSVKGGINEPPVEVENGEGPISGSSGSVKGDINEPPAKVDYGEGPMSGSSRSVKGGINEPPVKACICGDLEGTSKYSSALAKCNGTVEDCKIL